MNGLKPGNASAPALLHATIENMSEEPLIHTTRGNIPVSSLTHEVEWRITADIIHFTERYKSPDGEIVRQDAHVYTFGANADSTASL